MQNLHLGTILPSKTSQHFREPEWGFFIFREPTGDFEGEIYAYNDAKVSHKKRKRNWKIENKERL